MYRKHTFIGTFTLAKERRELSRFQAGFISISHPCIEGPEFLLIEVEEKICSHLSLIIILVGVGQLVGIMLAIGAEHMRRKAREILQTIWCQMLTGSKDKVTVFRTSPVKPTICVVRKKGKDVGVDGLL